MEISLKLDHEHIIKTYGSKQTADKFYIFMEYCPQGNLFEALIAKKRFTEDETRVITHQLLEAIKYCNSLNIVHK